MRNYNKHARASLWFIALTTIMWSLPPSAKAATVSASPMLAKSYSAIKDSLALLAYLQGDRMVSGSSFCIGNTDGTSLFLTNAHVVGDQTRIAVFLSSDPGRPLVGNVIRVNRSLDAAVLAVHASVRALTIGIDQLAEGQAVAIAGYPSAHIRLALAGLGLTASVHEGILSSYVADGALMEFDAQVEHGNSGGPVFDPETGLVYGMVTLKIGTDQTNLAIRIPSLFEFLRNAGVTVGQSTRALASAEVPSAIQSGRPAGQSPANGERVFATYVPLRNQDQLYDCDSGVTEMLSIRKFVNGNSGEYKVTSSWRGLQEQTPPIATLQSHNPNDDIMLLGYFHSDGSLQRLEAPVVAVPAQPSRGWERDMPTVNGTTVRRSWSGSTSLNLEIGNYDVQTYSDSLPDGGRFVAAYADRVGAVAVLLVSKDNEPILGCSLRQIVPIDQ